MTDVFKFGDPKLSQPFYVPAQPTTYNAAKTSQVWTTVRNISLDPTEPHAAACIRLLSQHHADADRMFGRMMDKLRRYPPRICLFDYTRKKDASVAVVDRRREPAKIFVDLRLAKALETAHGAYELRLRFILFASIFHELSHNLVSVLFGRRASDGNLRYKDWWGDNVSNAGSLGESGYVLEGHLFGGILGWGRRAIQDRTRPTRSMVIREALPGHWSQSNVEELFIRRGSAKDKNIDIIASLSSLSDRVNRIESVSPLTHLEVRRATLA